MMGPEVLLPPPVWRRNQDKRFSSRLMVSSLHCRLGRVMDISAGGMRVRGFAWPRLRTYGTMKVRIHGLALPVDVGVEVAWVNHCGLLRREVGLAFTGLTEDSLVVLRPLFRAAIELNGRRIA
jgi:hypothetical protein